MYKNLPKILSVKEVAEWLGVNPMTIYRKVRCGEIPARKLGKTWIFSEDALMEWLNSSEKPQGSVLIMAFAEKMPLLTQALPQIKLLYVFGSVKAGHATPLSDIDIAYLDDGTVKPFDIEAGLEETITNIVGKDRRVDLVRLNDAPIVIQYKVISEGKLVYKKAEDDRATFEESVVKMYLDYEPMMNKFFREAA